MSKLLSVDNPRSRKTSLSQPEQRRGSTVGPAFNSLYTQGAKLGAGAFSVVYECTENATGKIYAVKVMDRAKFGKLREAIDNEIKILQHLKHPSIIELKDVFQEPLRICIVTEKLTGGELMTLIESRPPFSEKEAREVTKQILEALRYMHDKGIIHRDLKPENILLKNSDSLSIKISDFGLSVFRQRDVTQDAAITDLAGTPSYMAPELLKNQAYDKTCDVWSVGVIMYLLLTKTFPFDSPSQSELFDLISAGKFSLEGKKWDSISAEAKALLRRLLKVVPSERYSVEEALNHPWISQVQGGEEDLTIVEMMRSFNLARKLKKAMLAVYTLAVWRKRTRQNRK